MSEIDDFKTQAELEKENLVLKRENKAALLTIDKLLRDLNKKSEQIVHLESLVSKTVPVIQPQPKLLKTSISAEEEIAIYQLERLRKIASERALTLEETRAYDILVKNKRLSQEESTITLPKTMYKDISNVDLLQVASQVQVSNDDSDPS